MHPSGGVFSSNETNVQPFVAVQSGKAFTSGENKSSKNLDIDITTDKKSKLDIDSINDMSIGDESKDKIEQK